MVYKLTEGMCLTCPRSVKRVLVDGFHCAACFRREFPGVPMPAIPEVAPPPPPLPSPPPRPKPKGKKEPKAVKKRQRRLRPEVAIWSPAQLLFQVLAVKAGTAQQRKWALEKFVSAVSDVDRMVVVMGEDDRDKDGTVRKIAGQLGWTMDYTHAVMRSLLGWEEAKLASLINDGVLKRGRNFVAEAARVLGWPKTIAWNAYKRLKRKGLKREIYTEHQIYAVLERGQEMTAREIADELETSSRWVYQVLTSKLGDSVTHRTDNNFGRRVYRLNR